jgi:hypothetical protein
MESFENVIRQIFYYTGEYGIANTPNYSPQGMSAEDSREFLKNCRKGFRLGQDLMVKQTVRILTEIKESKLKESKHSSNHVFPSARA